MSTNIVVPELGESIVEASVGVWLKHEGDRVKAGEPLVELETDKVNLQVYAERDGVLARIDHRQGDDVKIGDVLGVIEEQPQASGAPAQSVQPAATPRTPGNGQPAPTPQPPATEPAEETGRAVTPVARRMAHEYGVNLEQVPASGPAGRVTKQDVQSYLERQQPSQTAPSAPAPARREPAAPALPPSSPLPEARGTDREERIHMSRRRQTIAHRLLEAAQTTAMLTTFNEIDMNAVVEIRKRRRDSFKERHGVGLGFMSFFVKATLGALKAFPRLNAEIQGDDIILKHYYDIGIAVGAEEGLVVPVLREADRLSFAEIEQTIKDLSAKSQAGTLSLEDLRGGTFTITNGGVFGSLLSTPILNLPQVGILGLHKVEERPIALGGQVVVHPMMYVALSYDHRIVDGREAVQFLVRVKELMEDPETLLLEG